MKGRNIEHNVRWMIGKLLPDVDASQIRILLSKADNDYCEFIPSNCLPDPNQPQLRIAPRVYVLGPLSRLQSAVISTLARETHPRMLTRRIAEYDLALQASKARSRSTTDGTLVRQETRLDYEIRRKVLLDLTDLHLVADSQGIEFMKAHNLDPRGYLKFLRTEMWLNDNYITHPLRRAAHRQSIKVRLACARECISKPVDTLFYSKYYREEFERLLSSASLL